MGVNALTTPSNNGISPPFPLYNARATAIYNPEAVMNRLSMSSDDKPNAVPPMWLQMDYLVKSIRVFPFNLCLVLSGSGRELIATGTLAKSPMSSSARRA